MLFIEGSPSIIDACKKGVELECGSREGMAHQSLRPTQKPQNLSHGEANAPMM